MPAIDSRDLLLQEQVPTVMVPRYGEFEPLVQNGRRFLSASDGLWLEVRTDWLHVVWPLAQQNQVAMPYGMLEKKIKFLYGKFPIQMVVKFLADAREVFPSECAAWFTWNTTHKKFTYRLLKPIRTGVGFLEYEHPSLPNGECLVCDIHSHGPISAIFSSDDDKDDKGETKISAVVGELGSRQNPSMKFRLCAAGITIPINIDHERLLSQEGNDND